MATVVRGQVRANDTPIGVHTCTAAADFRGDIMIAWFGYLTTTITGFSDDHGHSWTQAFNVTGGLWSIACYWAIANADALTAGITLTLSVDCALGIYCTSYRGIDTNPYRTQVNATATSTSPASGTVSTVDGEDLLIGHMVTSSSASSITPSGGTFTQVFEKETANSFSSETEAIVPHPTTAGATWTLGVSAQWLAVTSAWRGLRPPTSPKIPRQFAIHRA